MALIKDIDSEDVSSTGLDAFNILKCNPGTFAGGTANARGNDGGTKDGQVLFKVTGAVLVRIFGVCTTDLTGAAGTIEVGVAGNTPGLIAQEVATEIDAPGIYISATQVKGVVAFASNTGPFIVVSDIIETIGTANITGGEMYYVCLWRPLTPDGNVESMF